MLMSHAPDVWSVQHRFTVRGVPISSRMTVVRLDGSLWLHSPVPISMQLTRALANLGPTRWLVAPSRAHHLFLQHTSQVFPQAEVWAAPGVPGTAAAPAHARGLEGEALQQWAPLLSGLEIAGMPQVNESLWFHAPSGTLIVTDWLQWWCGPLPWRACCWAHAMGVRRQPGVSRLFRRYIEDPRAYRQSLDALSDWPITRVLMAHNADVSAAPSQMRVYLAER